MKGLRVKCTTCGKVLHQTTEQYDPDKTPHGAMLELLNPWRKWGWSTFDDGVQGLRGTPATMMCCPNCSAPLVKNSRLTIAKDIGSLLKINQKAIDAYEPEEITEKPNPLQCEVCGKVCRSKLGLGSHMRSHKK